MPPLQIRLLTPDCVNWPAALDYAHSHLNTALLVAGDMMPPLRDLSVHAAALDGDRLAGVAVHFDGFATPTFSVAADSSDLVELLLRAIRSEQGLLAVSTDQPMPEGYARLKWSFDPWLRGPCVADLDAEGQSEAAVDPIELTDFYRMLNSPYWCPAMLESGRSRVIRDRGGAIVAAVSVQFVISKQYAHIGALATAPSHRGQGFARTLLCALRSTLARDGVQDCGMFAEAAHPWLEQFYGWLGFHTVGWFRFAEIPSRTETAP
jgi:ribosomal protein S18 acetylase RimI-like enzyme